MFAGFTEELVDGVQPDPDLDLEEERRYPSTIGGAFYLLVLATCIVGVGVVVTGEWRTGIRVFGGALLLGSLVRLLLPKMSTMPMTASRPIHGA